jgi:hypothetical protein
MPYKCFSLSGSNALVYAHQYMYRLTKGSVPEGLVVRHTCDNPSCVNPEHLIVGTYKDNTQDAVARGRNAFAERSGTAKLTSVEVRAIRALYSCGCGFTQTQLGKAFGVTQANISLIVRGDHWRRYGSEEKVIGGETATK